MPIFPDFEDQFINERNKPALFKKDFYFTVEETKKFVLEIITEAKIDPYNIQFLTFCDHYITKLSVDYLSKEKFAVIRQLVGMYNDKDMLDDFIRLNITLENNDIFRILYGYSIKVAERIDFFLDSRIKSQLNELLADEIFINRRYSTYSFTFAIPLFTDKCFCKTYTYNSSYIQRNKAGYDMCECKVLFEEMIFYKDYIRSAETKGFLEFELNNASITMNIYRDIPTVYRFLYLWQINKPYTELTVYQTWRDSYKTRKHPACDL